MPDLDRFSLKGRTALVTGGSRGIGRAIALAMAGAGAQVAVCARHRDACEKVAEEIIDAGGTAISVAGNVGHAEDAGTIVAAVMERFGALDILVNNAATNPQFGMLVDAEDAAVDRVFEVNVQGPLRLISAAVHAWMGQHGGSIINMASVGGINPEPMIGAYNASKAALINLTRTLSHELGRSGIRVNAIAPGLVDTEFAKVLIETPKIHERIIRGTALKRHAEPDEIAGAAVFLASGAASYVTGSVIVVDGGATA
ncbi:SDR family oxidoreductase [Candidatus Aeolococcus gillhamiae]|uniref:SDR family oxidoreductase n=1 Tax=Candidatus Aeolococcus gillhamiae TaxID=3127015 RepID=UPI003077C616